MGDETSDTMNLDLNLGPGPESGPAPVSNPAVNLDTWINHSSERATEAVTRFRTRQRSRFRHLHIPLLDETQSLAIELNQLMGSSANGTALQTGEGSIAAEARVNEESKTCENGNGVTEDSVSEKKCDIEKSTGSDGSFFDCNICLDLAKEPVVTCCGHLFCWPCLYQWLHISDAKECPVCKGEVTQKTVTPIYGRGNLRRESEEISDAKIPMRPHARRIESLRQTLQRSPFSIPMEEMIRRIQSRFDRDSTPVPDFNSREGTERIHERASSILNRFMTSRGVRGEQNPVASAAAATASDDMDMTQSIAPDLEGETQRFHPLLLRRQLQSHRVSRISSLSSALSSAERLVDAYFRSHPLGRNQEQNPPIVDDRDSFSSIAAVINSESQVDTAVEIDSMVTLSTSSSRRRNENTSRVSDVDSADSRAPRRRRLS